ncbi:MAG TPA: DUF6691 family protein [Xanthobacteraceae bacterium]|nr:DUF6691 family protein [Xanthobacteraceae bacterium]
MLPLVGLFCGFVFGCGLLVSGMVSPAKVLAFLDVLGAWDPSLAVVMAAALAVTATGFALARRRGRPLLAERCDWPTRSTIDAPLALGAVTFGAGWGLVGLCPGPAVENLATLSPPVLVFVAAMLAGMALHDVWQRRRTAPARAASAAPVEADG